jgi:hypothetical protein
MQVVLKLVRRFKCCQLHPRLLKLDLRLLNDALGIRQLRLQLIQPLLCIRPRFGHHRLQHRFLRLA